jgi:hypothetical protein
MGQSMSVESQFVKPESGRFLRPEEAVLIRALLVGVYPAEALEDALRDSRVTDMQDGGMGSIRFLGSGPKSFGMALVEAQYLDSDGVLVSITVNGDKQGEAGGPGLVIFPNHAEGAPGPSHLGTGDLETGVSWPP